MKPKESAEIIYAQFKKPRFPDEQEATNLYGEHMVEVGQYLKRKAIERAERSGKHNYNPVTVTNSKFWYEVRKKINEVLEQEKAAGNKRASQNEDDSDNEAGHAVITPQTSLDTEVINKSGTCCKINLNFRTRIVMKLSREMVTWRWMSRSR